MSQKRLKLMVKGAVQGVGFRPFVYRLAIALNIKGWVKNTSAGVLIEGEGEEEVLNLFVQKISEEKPPHAHIQSWDVQWLEVIGYTSFAIRSSEETEKTTLILPDLSTCSACLQELFDPKNRRYHYPFINCTHCGPRYSIIEALPYDRPQTTMKRFKLCSLCEQEYFNPLDRRFHAQPNACPSCGPHLELWDGQGKRVATHQRALDQAIEALQGGKIVAVKGIGGFHLMAAVNKENTVKLLRQRKHRPHKPLALMYPSLDRVKQDCEVSDLEATLLTSAQSPIVLLKCQQNKGLAASIAPSNPYLGVMLPYTPLHHLLLQGISMPLVATSGNLADEPICIDENEAIQRLNGVADLFLLHNRPIVRSLDDSIVRVMGEQVMILRRGRGYAPFPLKIEAEEVSQRILAVGGQLKNTIAILQQGNIFISQHIGDLGTEKADEAFSEVIRGLTSLYDFKPQMIVCDKHPDYGSTQYARKQNLEVRAVQHHYAHILATMADHDLKPPVLGVAWDGTGYGDDGTIWGGEFLEITQASYERVAYFQPFPLLGGEKAIKEPRRVALGLIYQIYGDFQPVPPKILSSFKETELSILQTLLTRQLNTPLTSSVGRLFDAIAALLGLEQQVTFEGQAAMALEFAAMKVKTEACYDFSLSHTGIIQWHHFIPSILEQIHQNVPLEIIAATFHNTLVEIILAIANQRQLERVVLSGGCFQNKYLTEKTIFRLKQAGFKPYWPQTVPPNDGGISVGQILAVLHQNCLT